MGMLLDIMPECFGITIFFLVWEIWFEFTVVPENEVKDGS